MDKIRHREKQSNIIIMFVGVVLVIGLLLINREGLTWFSSLRWKEVSTISRVSIISILTVGLILQYFFLMLLRHSVIKYFILWLTPVIWLFNNGLIALYKFFDWTTDIVSPTGWVPLGDLSGWLLSVVYFPLLLASGVVVAIIDSSSAMLNQICYYAGIAMDVANISPWNIVSNSMNYIIVLWDLVSNSFAQEIASLRTVNREFLEFNLSNIFSLPYWILSIGYSFTCIII
ncbi:hypothetical protein OAB56_02430 [Gammaproteobacteria bacterium]|nr:hypothetical protein [Gammaproteobacteria bacterium]|tara:strand:- start:303 stop:995 length:693 start_codon:yes stop_codon:yes gene_type:complete